MNITSMVKIASLVIHLVTLVMELEIATVPRVDTEAYMATWNMRQRIYTRVAACLDVLCIIMEIPSKEYVSRAARIVYDVNLKVIDASFAHQGITCCLRTRKTASRNAQVVIRSNLLFHC